jgi:hypothetical protein
MVMVLAVDPFAETSWDQAASEILPGSTTSLSMAVEQEGSLGNKLQAT